MHDRVLYKNEFTFACYCGVLIKIWNRILNFGAHVNIFIYDLLIHYSRSIKFILSFFDLCYLQVAFNSIVLQDKNGHAWKTNYNIMQSIYEMRVQCSVVYA
jgi:uncharacterized membrane protein